MKKSHLRIAWTLALLCIFGVSVYTNSPWDTGESPLEPSGVTAPESSSSSTSPSGIPLSGEPKSNAEESTLLERIGPERYRSPAGLIYGPGSEQGHRLRHVMRHAVDQPMRPGQHGVFVSDDVDDVISIIDQAYRKAQQREQTQTEVHGNRSVHTTDLGQIIGYVGGQVGNRRGRPEARHVRLVLEQQRVITAYPVIPWNF